MSREITKIGLAVLKENCLLLVRKRGSDFYILPGGKPERGEDDISALAREIDEELGCHFEMHTLSYIGSFSDIAAGMSRTKITVKLYLGELVGEPTPTSEIDEVLWLDPSKAFATRLAPSLINSIIPHLFSSDAFGISGARAHL